MRARFLLGAVVIAAALGAACGNGQDADPHGDSASGGNGTGTGGNSGGGKTPGTGGSTNGTGGNGTGGTNGTGGNGTGGSGGSDVPPRQCDVPEPGPRVLRLLTRWEYARALADLLGIDPPDVNRVPGMGIVQGFDNDARAGIVTERHLDSYSSLAEEFVARAIQQNRGKFVPCQAGCEKDVIKSFGRAAFRRPLTDEEVTRYAGLFDASLTEGKFEEGVKLAMQAMLISPHFIYRSEVGERKGNGLYDLTPHEAASALSFGILGLAPDAELNAAADKGELQTPAQLEKQVRRLLATAKAKPQAVEFMRQWLGTKAFPYANKDAAVYPQFSTAIRDAMIQEEAAFLSYVAFDGTKTYDELFKADYTFSNVSLAQYYGISGGQSTEFSKVNLGPTSKRGGLLTLGAFVSTHAHSAETSPIKRGVFVRRQLLCQPLSSPPPTVNTTPPGLDPNLSTRERFARHTNDPNCVSCHKLIDGVGFGFESFDAVGAYRTEEKNGTKTIPVDAKGWIIGLELGTDTRLEFDGPRELGAKIATSPTAHRCFAKQYYRFARGYRENTVDQCAVADLETKFAAGKRDIQELILTVFLQDSFLHRREGEF